MANLIYIPSPGVTEGTPLTDHPCFEMGCKLNPAQRKAIKILCMAEELAHNGGTDYTSALVSTLPSAVTAATRMLNLDQRAMLDVIIDYHNANTAGAALSTDVNVLVASTKAIWQGVNDMDMDAAILYLKSLLGAHRTPPA